MIAIAALTQTARIEQHELTVREVVLLHFHLLACYRFQPGYVLHLHGQIALGHHDVRDPPQIVSGILRGQRHVILVVVQHERFLQSHRGINTMLDLSKSKKEDSARSIASPKLIKRYNHYVIIEGVKAKIPKN
jgi:hypothetical protein